VTVGIDFPIQIVGNVAAILMKVGYPAPLLIPGTGTDATVRSSITNLAGTGASIVGIMDKDTNSDAVDDQLQAGARKTTGSLPSAALFRVHYQCPAGTNVSLGSFTCSHEQEIDGSGSVFDPAVAALIDCVLSVSAP
jgi:hypothetical protein